MDDIKYVLTEEDVRKLPQDDERRYTTIMDRLYQNGTISRVDLEYLDDLLQQQYSHGLLRNASPYNLYTRILARNLNGVVDIVLKNRNEMVNGNKLADEFTYGKMLEGLNEMKKMIEEKLPRYQARNTFGTEELEGLLSRIDALREQVSKDMQFDKGFKQAKSDALARYKVLKEQYDRLSLFGKLAARVNGKAQELKEAKEEHLYYGNVNVPLSANNTENIVNSPQYQEYIDQQLEQNAGGVRR